MCKELVKIKMNSVGGFLQDLRDDLAGIKAGVDRNDRQGLHWAIEDAERTLNAAQRYAQMEGGAA